MRRPVKLVVTTAACVGGLLLVSLFVMMSGVFDITERSYRSKEDAIRDRAFERGWLPAFIPQSATEITLEHNSDVSLTYGTFQFRAEEFLKFTEAIHSSDDGDRKHGVALLREEQLLREGYKIFNYNHGDYCCRFLIHPEQGRCEFAAGGIFTAN